MVAKHSHIVKPLRPYRLDAVAEDSVRQYFSTNTKGKPPLGMTALGFDLLLFPPDQRVSRIEFMSSMSATVQGLLLFFSATLGDYASNDGLGIASVVVASVPTLTLTAGTLFSMCCGMLVTGSEVTDVYVVSCMLGWTMLCFNVGSIFAFVAYVLTALSMSQASLVSWLVAFSGLVIFGAVNVFFSVTLFAHHPLLQMHQQGWYTLMFSPNIALSNFVMGRKSLKEGAEAYLAKKLRGPVPEDLKKVLAEARGDEQRRWTSQPSFGRMRFTRDASGEG